MRQDGKILLVRQQGPDDPEPFWALPGGRCKQGELVTETLERGVTEKTGLTVTSVADLVCIAQMHNPRLLSRSAEELPPPGGIAMALVFAVAGWRGTIASGDPDNLVTEAEFVEESQAIDRLQTLPWRFLREPALAYLQGRVPAGTVWLYRRNERSEDDLVNMVVGSGPPIKKEAILKGSREGERTAPSFQASMLTIGCMGIVFLLGIILVIGIISAAH